MIGFSKPFLNKAPQHFGFPKIRVSPKVGVASNLFSQSSLVKFLPQSNNLGKSGKYISTTSLGGIIEEKGETAKKFQDNRKRSNQCFANNYSLSTQKGHFFRCFS